MWGLELLAFAGKLLGALRKPLGSLWLGLVPLLLRLREAFGLVGTDGGQGPRVRGEPEGGGEDQEGPEDGSDGPLTPTSVNYHFTRQCNYKCGFCFHTAKTSFVLPLEEAQRGLRMLKEAGESPAPETSGCRPRAGAGVGDGGGHTGWFPVAGEGAVPGEDICRLGEGPQVFCRQPRQQVASLPGVGEEAGWGVWGAF